MTPQPSTHIINVPLDKLHLNPWQMWPLDPDHISELAADIKINGLIQPPKARPAPKHGADHYELAVGHHRRAAYAQLGLETMPIIYSVITDLEMADFAISENFKRRTPSAIDKARALQRLTSEPFKLTHEQAGQRFGLSGTAVTNLLKLLRLPSEIQADVASGELPERLARQVVRIAGIDEKAVTKFVKDVVALPAPEREAALKDHMADILHKKGRNLYNAPFETTWPAAPIALETPLPTDDGESLTTIQACTRCRFFLNADHNSYCMFEACFQEKSRRVVDAKLAEAFTKTGIPVKASDEKCGQIEIELNWNNQEALRKVIADARKNNIFGLRFAWSDKGDYNWHRLLGDDQLRVVALDLDALNQHLRAVAQAKSNGAAAPKTTPANETDAQKQKRLDAEEAEREARRQERSAALRQEHDIAWLIKSVTPTLAAQLTISGHTLHYVTTCLVSVRAWSVNDITDMSVWFGRLKDNAQDATGKDADDLRRQYLVASQIIQRFSVNDDFDETRELILQLATATDYDDDSDAGFGTKLPRGWDTPPIHRTDYNCWNCGTFATSTTLTKRELELGWKIISLANKTTGVYCPDCKAPAVGVPLVGTPSAKSKPTSKAAKSGPMPRVGAGLVSARKKSKAKR